MARATTEANKDDHGLRTIYMPPLYVRLKPEEAQMPNTYPDQTDARPSTFEPVIEAELAVLASIETRYWDELTKLECSALPAPVKDNLRQQLETKRRMAREPHVLRLAQLHEEGTMRTMFSLKTRH